MTFLYEYKCKQKQIPNQIIHNLCKRDDYSDGAFNEVRSTITENLVNALSKITQTQEAIENKMNAFA